MNRRIRKPGAKGAGKGNGNENNSGGDDYEVGYGKPPVHSQFQKGRSGNPKGKPKGRKNTKTMIRDILFEPLPMQINGKTQNLTGFEGNVLRLRQAGLGGDFRSAVHVVQLGMSLDPDAETEKPEVEAMHFDQRTFNALLRDYLKHNGSDDDATDNGPASPDDGEEDA
jgi:hypothetical protein